MGLRRGDAGCRRFGGADSARRARLARSFSQQFLAGTRYRFAGLPVLPRSPLRNGRHSLSLWDQQLSTATYTTYDSSTYVEKGTQPILGADSSLCLSCHDGTVAVGTNHRLQEDPDHREHEEFRRLRHRSAILASV